jgi:uncharacterized protein YceH (UPF0502 family)
MEKELATPDNYPLTINSLTLACNQKSNREPVMHLTQGEVGHTVNELADRDLVRVEYGERAHRVFQRMRSSFSLDRKQQAVLTVLMLRRPQTLNDIRVRTDRMGDFDGAEEILLILDDLMQRDPPLVLCLPHGAGRREDRYAHTLCGEVEMEKSERALPPLPDSEPGRIERLEERVAELESQLGALLERMGK